MPTMLCSSRADRSFAAFCTTIKICVVAVFVSCFHHIHCAEAAYCAAGPPTVLSSMITGSITGVPDTNIGHMCTWDLANISASASSGSVLIEFQHFNFTKDAEATVEVHVGSPSTRHLIAEFRQVNQPAMPICIEGEDIDEGIRIVLKVSSSSSASTAQYDELSLDYTIRESDSNCTVLRK